MRILMFIGVLLIASCSATQKVAENVDANGDFTGFYSVANFQQFVGAHIRSPESFKGYTAIVYAPLKVDNIEIDRARLSTKSKTWTVKRGDAQKARAYFSEQVERYYSKVRNFDFGSSAAAEKTLKIAVELVKFKPNSPRDTTVDRNSGTAYFAEGVGRLYMQAHVYDAATGELLGRFTDDRELGSTWQKDSRTNNVRRFKDGLRAWIQRLDDGLAMLR